MRDIESRGEPLGRSTDEPLERLPVPVGEVVLWRLSLDDLLAFLRLFRQPQVLDHVLRGLGDDEAAIVEPFPAGATGDLVEVAGGEDRRLLPVELAEPGEEHGADGDVDAHAQGVGAANDFEQTALGELLHQHPVFREETGMVHSDAVPKPFPDRGSVGAGEAEVGNRFRHSILLIAGRELEAGEALRAVRGVFLSEVDDVDGRFAFVGELLHRLRQWDLGIGILERHRTDDGLHRRGRPAVSAGELLLEERDVAQRRRHQEEARLRQSEKRHLPGDAAVAVGVPVELVHHHRVHGRVLPFAERDVGEHLRGAAQDGGVAVHGRVSRRQTDVLRAELTAERHPFLVDERLDGAGVDGAVSPRERGEVEGGGDERFPRAGRSIQDDVPALEELENRLLLRGIEHEVSARHIVEEASEKLVGRGLAPRAGNRRERRPWCRYCGPVPRIVPWRRNRIRGTPAFLAPSPDSR